MNQDSMKKFIKKPVPTIGVQEAVDTLAKAASMVLAREKGTASFKEQKISENFFKEVALKAQRCLSDNAHLNNSQTTDYYHALSTLVKDGYLASADIDTNMLKQLALVFHGRLNGRQEPSAEEISSIVASLGRLQKYSKQDISLFTNRQLKALSYTFSQNSQRIPSMDARIRKYADILLGLTFLQCNNEPAVKKLMGQLEKQSSNANNLAFDVKTTKRIWQAAAYFQTIQKMDINYEWLQPWIEQLSLRKNRPVSSILHEKIYSKIDQQFSGQLFKGERLSIRNEVPLFGFYADIVISFKDKPVWPKVIVEVDGEDYHAHTPGQQHDALRDTLLKEHGYKVIHITGTQWNTFTETGDLPQLEEIRVKLTEIAKANYVPRQPSVRTTSTHSTTTVETPKSVRSENIFDLLLHEEHSDKKAPVKPRKSRSMSNVNFLTPGDRNLAPTSDTSTTIDVDKMSQQASSSSQTTDDEAKKLKQEKKREKRRKQRAAKKARKQAKAAENEGSELSENDSVKSSGSSLNELLTSVFTFGRK